MSGTSPGTDARYAFAAADAPPQPLSVLLARDRELRRAGHDDAEYADTLARLRSWQAVRLATTYADFAVDPRHAQAVQFFLDELYGDVDHGPRDQDLERALRALERALPASAIETLRRAIQLEVLTQELDADVAARLPPRAPITGRAYATAYRTTGTRELRERQIGWTVGLGATLDGLVARPGIGLLIRLARGPARAAGFGALHEFLERGYRAFDRIGGAGRFLASVREREYALLEALYAGHPDPFDAPPASVAPDSPSTAPSAHSGAGGRAGAGERHKPAHRGGDPP